MNSNFAKLLEALAKRPEPKQPLTSPGQLTKWVVAARKDVNQVGDLSIDETRLGWLVASAVVVSVLQRARNSQNDALFLLKGGSYLQYRLGLQTRATSDIDGLARGEMKDFLDKLDDVLRESWGGLDLSRTEIEIISVPGKIIKPRRFSVLLQVRGVTWRSIRVEVSPDEGGIGQEFEALPVLPLSGVGLPTPDELFGVAIRNQIAQKLHAVTDPHSPPDFLNERARDLVDLVLLRRAVDEEGLPSYADIRDACVRVFEARANEAAVANRLPRAWPPVVSVHSSWPTDFGNSAAQVGLNCSYEEAIEAVNDWIHEIETSRP